jgi:hypothetical protein
MSSKSPNDAGKIKLDPACTGSTVRRAFLIEAILNLCSFPLITHPRLVLSIILNHSSYINPASILFAKLFGGVVIGGLTPGLLYGYQNTRQGIDSRRSVYYALGLGEIILIPLLLQEAAKDGKSDAALSTHGALGAIMMLAPPLLWRIYVLFGHPEMLGRYTEVKTE